VLSIVVLMVIASNRFAPIYSRSQSLRNESRFFEEKGAPTMAASTIWDGLTRPEQRLLIKLFGCGSTRNENPVVVDALRSRGLLDENSELSMAGLFVFTLAMREQQESARLRAAGR
jgi:hypothetical protein